MPRLASLALVATLATTAACSNSVTADGLGIDTQSLEFAFHSRESSRTASGDALNTTVVVLTDREDLCEAAEAAGGVNPVDDMTSVQIITATNGDANTVDSNATLGDILANPATFQGFVATRVVERRGGETVLHAISRNVIELDTVSRGEFVVSGTSSSPSRTKISGSFESVVELDLTDGGEDPLSVDISGRFSGAVGCEALGGNAEVPQ